MWAAISRFILTSRLPLLAALAAITLFLGYKATEVKISHKGGKVLPADDQAYLDYVHFKSEFGEDGNILVIGFSGDQMWDLWFYRDWYALTNSIQRMEGVRQVLSTARWYMLEKDTAQQRFALKEMPGRLPADQNEVDSLRNLLDQQPFYSGILFNPDTLATLMAISLDPDNLNSVHRIQLIEEIQLQARALESRHGMEFHFSGLPFVRTAITKKVSSEFRFFIILALIITALVLLIFFRSIAAVIMPLIVVAVAVVWSLGLMVLLEYEITLLTGLIPPLLIVIGIPNSILMLNKYHVEFRKHRNQRRALLMMIRRIGFTTFIANLTTAIGFGVFVFTNSQILIEFGLVTSVMVMCTWAIALIVIPSVFSFMPSPGLRHTQHLENSKITALLDAIHGMALGHRKTVYVVSALLVLVSVVGVYRIQSNGYVVDDLPEDDPVSRDLGFFEDYFAGVLPLEIVVDAGKPGRVNTLALQHKMERLSRLMAEYPEFSKGMSMTEVLKYARQAFYNGHPSMYAMPRNHELAFIMRYAGNLEESGSTLGKLTDTAQQKARLSFQMADIGSARMDTLLSGLRPKIDSIFNPETYKVQLTGSSLVFLRSNHYLVGNLRESLFLAIAIISVVMLMLFRSYNPALLAISLLPNLIPLLMTAGIMGFFNIPLKPSTILIFSIAFGIASDQTIYFLTKFRQELKYRNGSVEDTLRETLHETGISMLYTALILFFGFGIFVMSNFGGTVFLGLLISVTLLLALIANLTLLPVLIISLDKKGANYRRNKILASGNGTPLGTVPGKKSRRTVKTIDP